MPTGFFNSPIGSGFIAGCFDGRIEPFDESVHSIGLKKVRAG